MPLTLPGKQALKALHRASSADMGLVTTTLPIREGDCVLGADGEPYMMTVHIRPCFDQAFCNPYMASDVFFEDLQEHRLSLFGARKRAILAEIKRDQPLVWAEIEAAASNPLAA